MSWRIFLNRILYKFLHITTIRLFVYQLWVYMFLPTQPLASNSERLMYLLIVATLLMTNVSRISWAKSLLVINTYHTLSFFLLFMNLPDLALLISYWYLQTVLQHHHTFRSGIFGALWFCSFSVVYPMQNNCSRGTLYDTCRQVMVLWNLLLRINIVFV